MVWYLGLGEEPSECMKITTSLMLLLPRPWISSCCWLPTHDPPGPYSAVSFHLPQRWHPCIMFLLQIDQIRFFFGAVTLTKPFERKRIKPTGCSNQFLDPHFKQNHIYWCKNLTLFFQEKLDKSWLRSGPHCRAEKGAVYLPSTWSIRVKCQHN